MPYTAFASLQEFTDALTLTETGYLQGCKHLLDLSQAPVANTGSDPSVVHQYDQLNVRLHNAYVNAAKGVLMAVADNLHSIELVVAPMAPAPVMTGGNPLYTMQFTDMALAKAAIDVTVASFQDAIRLVGKTNLGMPTPPESSSNPDPRIVAAFADLAADDVLDYQRAARAVLFYIADDLQAISAQLPLLPEMPS